MYVTIFTKFTQYFYMANFESTKSQINVIREPQNGAPIGLCNPLKLIHACHFHMKLIKRREILYRLITKVLDWFFSQVTGAHNLPALHATQVTL